MHKQRVKKSDLFDVKKSIQECENNSSFNRIYNNRNSARVRRSFNISRMDKAYSCDNSRYYKAWYCTTSWLKNPVILDANNRNYIPYTELIQFENQVDKLKQHMQRFIHTKWKTKL